MYVQLTKRHLERYLLAYLIFTVGFAITFFLRITDFINMGFWNLLFYDIYYFLMPSIGIFVLVNVSNQHSYEKVSEMKRYSALVVNLIVAALIGTCLFVLDIGLPFVYIVIPFVLPIVIFIFLKKNREKLLLSKKKLAVTLSLIILIPYFTLSLGFYSKISVIGTFEEEEKIVAVSDYIRNIVIPFWNLKGFEREYVRFHRASTDFIKFLLVGGGSCGEMAFSAKAIYDQLNLKSRVVSLAGEDHMFVELYRNGNWSVVDPGYALNLLTREERGLERLKEMGGLSYVVTHTQEGFIDLTKYYVKTDQILVRVTEDGVPTSEVKVTLRHVFNGDTISLPDFYTNIEGIVEIELGPMDYNKTSVFPAESFYRIFINDKNSNKIVSSTGSGKSHSIEIDIASMD